MSAVVSAPDPLETADPRGDFASSRMLGLAGSLLALALLASVVALVWYQFREDRSRALERHELLARVLEDHATRVIDGAGQATSALADLLLRDDGMAPAELASAVRQTLANQSGLRALAVLDGEGSVLAGAGTVDSGTRVDLRQLGLLPAAGKVELRPYLAGRGLPLVGTPTSGPQGLGVMPVLQLVQRGDRPAWLVVALLNPDLFANFQEQTLRDTRRSAALIDFDGQVLAATHSSGLQAQQRLMDLVPLQRYLPGREQGSWIGPGLRMGERLAAFRALRQHALFVMVDIDHAAVTSATVERVRWFVVAGVSAALLIVLLSLAAARAQRAREQSRLALDAAQAALAARARELDGVFASVRELLFRTDARGLLELMNAGWARAHALPLAQALGRPLEQLVAPASRELVASLFVADAQGLAKRAEVAMVDADGQTRLLEMTVVPLFERGHLLGFAGSAVDMTELLSTQRQLRAQLAFNGSLIESNPLPMVVLDTMNRYVRVNRAWESFTGRSRDRVVGTLASLAHAPDLARLHDQRDRQLMSEGGEAHYEAQALRADGQLRDISISKAVIVGPEGKPQGILGAFMDVSQFREAERATREARDMAERASKAKSAFIANVSHELRTPLQAILGFSDLGSRRALLSPRDIELFQEIHRAGDRMLVLVNELLDLSRLDRPGFSLQTTPQDLVALLREVVAELAPLAAARGLRLPLALPPQPTWLTVDGGRLQQVMRNLLANAIRLSPYGARIELSLEVLPEQVELRVADEGPGLHPDELESIFEPFVQSSRPLAALQGTGLGLAIARSIVRAHGGQILAANRSAAPRGEPGAPGAVFTVILPRAPQASAAASPQPAPDL
ncbi:MAG: PAS domain S-box protein [Rubrivivax sp.]|nr:PAS domain S-box protein [Rubrivivax sp.]